MVKRKAIKRLPFRRRRKGLTNYRVRLKMLLSGRPLLVIRKTNTQTIVQVVKPEVKGDVVLAQATGKELKAKFGWPASGKSTPAAYLTGYLAGLRAIKAGVKEAIPYIGLHRAVKGARVFAALKGALDAGLSVPHSLESLPPEDRIKGVHIAKYVSLLKESNTAAFEKRFSAYLKSGFNPEKIVEVFEEVKKKIEKSVQLQIMEMESEKVQHK